MQAVKTKNINWIAGHMIYPLSVASNGKTRIVKSKDEFMAIAKQKWTDKICTEILDSAQKPLFKNWKGVMVGDGILWFLEYQSDERSPSQFGITAIGNFAFQPDELKPSEH